MAEDDRVTLANQPPLGVLRGWAAAACSWSRGEAASRAKSAGDRRATCDCASQAQRHSAPIKPPRHSDPSTAQAPARRNERRLYFPLGLANMVADRAAAISAVEERVQAALAANDASHDWAHIERVRALALRIAADEGAARAWRRLPALRRRAAHFEPGSAPAPLAHAHNAPSPPPPQASPPRSRSQSSWARCCTTRTTGSTPRRGRTRARRPSPRSRCGALCVAARRGGASGVWDPQPVQKARALTPPSAARSPQELLPPLGVDGATVATVVEIVTRIGAAPARAQQQLLPFPRRAAGRCTR